MDRQVKPGSGAEPSTMNRSAEVKSPGDRSVPWNRYLVFSCLVIGGAAADLLTKQWVFQWRGLPAMRTTWWLIDGYVGIETAVNPGALFGFGAGHGLVFAGLSVLAAIAILVTLFGFGAAHQWWLTIALGCVMAGIFGNLYDRLGLWWQADYPDIWKSGVRDWILLQLNDDLKWPNFNIADSLLVCGAAILFWKSMFPGPMTDGAANQDGQ